MAEDDRGHVDENSAKPRNWEAKGQMVRFVLMTQRANSHGYPNEAVGVVTTLRLGTGIGQHRGTCSYEHFDEPIRPVGDDVGLVAP